jgi:hypothetical protein
VLKRHIPALIIPEFDPRVIPGLKLWLRADDIAGVDGDPVTLWRDLSGNGHNATESVNPPILKTNVINHHNTARFNGSTQFLTIPNHADFNLAAPWHLFVIVTTDIITGTFYAWASKASAWAFQR